MRWQLGLVWLAGCSFLGSSPHAFHERGKLTCNETFVTLDVLATLVGAGLAGLATDDGLFPGADNTISTGTAPYVAVPAVVFAVATGISALYGNDDLDRCALEIERLRRR